MKDDYIDPSRRNIFEKIKRGGGSRRWDRGEGGGRGGGSADGRPACMDVDLLINCYHEVCRWH